MTPVSAIDRFGNVYAAFSLRLGGEAETHIYLIHSSDHGVHWSAPARVDAGSARSNVLSTLAVGDPGHVTLGWYGSDSVDFTDANARWFETVATSTDALSEHPAFIASRLGGVTHVGSVDASGNPGSSLNNWALRDFQSVAIDAAGRAHVAWTDDTGRGVTRVARQMAETSVRRIRGPTVLPKKLTHPRLSKHSHLAATGVGDGTIEGWLLVALSGALVAFGRRRGYR